MAAMDTSSTILWSGAPPVDLNSRPESSAKWCAQLLRANGILFGGTKGLSFGIPCQILASRILYQNSIEIKILTNSSSIRSRLNLPTRVINSWMKVWKRVWRKDCCTSPTCFSDSMSWTFPAPRLSNGPNHTGQTIKRNGPCLIHSANIPVGGRAGPPFRSDRRSCQSL